MLSFIASGGKDENRKQFIDTLFQRGACLNEDVERVKAFASIPGYESVYAQIKEIDTSSTSLIDALNDKSLSPEEHVLQETDGAYWCAALLLRMESEGAKTMDSLPYFLRNRCC